MGIYKLSTAGGLATPRTNYSSFLAGNPRFIPTSYESIATYTVGVTPQSSITFSDIPQGYKHLQIRWIARQDTAGQGDSEFQARFNSDSGANYKYHAIFGDGTTAYASAGGNTFFAAGRGVSASIASNIYGVSVMDILDYTDTNKNKVTRILSGWDANGSGYMFLYSGLWVNTNAVTSITLLGDTGSFIQNSQFALYGIRG
jgi:hypothetical protein